MIRRNKSKVNVLEMLFLGMITMYFFLFALGVNTWNKLGWIYLIITIILIIFAFKRLK